MNRYQPVLLATCYICILLMGTAQAAPYGAVALQQELNSTPGDTSHTDRIPIDTDRSRIHWRGTEMWESGKHEGTLQFKEGALLVEDGRITGGHIIADMNSIGITDIPASEPVPRKRLRDHLKSDDFFHTERYPFAEFTFSEVNYLGGDSLDVRGDLRIRDVTKAISFTAIQNRSKTDGTTLVASITIDRFAWNVAYQESYWNRITSILDNNLVDADIHLSIRLAISSPG